MALPTHKTSRSHLLQVGVGGAAALIVPGSAWAMPTRVNGAAALPDNDLAYLRLLIGAELLAIDFHGNAIAARKKLGAALAVTFRRALADERAHYALLSKAIVDAGQPSTGPGDVDFTYPRGSFATRASIARLGWRIESLLLGSYLGAVENVQTPELRLPVGQIAANESQHVAAVAPAAGKARIGRAFPAALSIEAASDALDAFES